MSSNLSTNKKLVTIGKAAEILGVSIDTVRRWDKDGILHSKRPNGKDRFFNIDELEKHKFQKPLSISEVSERTGISQTTLRRLEKRKILIPKSSNGGERLYDKDSLEDFLKSQYFLKQKEVESKILEPLTQEGEELTPLETHEKIVETVVGEQEQHIGKLLKFRKGFYLTGISIATVGVVSIIGLTVMFLLNPVDTGRFFGFQPEAGKKLSMAEKKSNVLGAHYVAPSPFSGFLQPLAQLALGVVKKVNLPIYKQILGANTQTRINNVNDIFAIDSVGNIRPKYTISLPDRSYLQVKPPFGDGGTTNVTNTSQELVFQTTGQSGVSLESNGSSLADGSVIGGLGGIIADGTITSDDIKDLGITDGSLAQITTANKVAGSAVQLSSSGGLTNNSGLSLLTSCSSSQVLVWNGSAWACSTPSAGGVT